MSDEPEIFLIGPLTKSLVFEPSGLHDVSDLQAVLDALERALSGKAITDLSIDGVNLEDGDLLVITSPRPMSSDHYFHLREMARDMIAGLGVKAEVLLLDAGMQAGILKTSQLPRVEEPLTDVQRSVRDGTFGVKSANISDRSVGFKAQGN